MSTEQVEIQEGVVYEEVYFSKEDVASELKGLGFGDDDTALFL